MIESPFNLSRILNPPTFQFGDILHTRTVVGKSSKKRASIHYLTY